MLQIPVPLHGSSAVRPTPCTVSSMKKTCSALIPVLAALMFIPALAEASTPLSSLGSATATNSFDNSGYGQSWTWNGLTGYGLDLETTSTAAGNGSAVVFIHNGSAPTASGVTTFGLLINDVGSGTGTNTTVYGINSTAGGGTKHNYGIYGGAVSGVLVAGDAGVWGDAGETGTALGTYGVYGTNESSGGYGGYFTNTNGGYALATGSGNVGIGTASPVATLHIYTNGDTSPRALRISGTDANGYGEIQIAGDAHEYRIGVGGSTSSAPNDMYFYDNTAATTRMLITSGGSVGIGNTSPAYLLHVGSSSASGVVAEFQNSAGDCTLTPSSGTLGIACASDARLKRDIEDSGSALTWLSDIRIRDYTIKSTGQRQTGVIAQEMQSGHPDMVHVGKNGFYKVDEPNPWRLAKAIQELKADNDNLQAKLTADEATIAAMKTKLGM